jgi:hypothetical protein
MSDIAEHNVLFPGGMEGRISGTTFWVKLIVNPQLSSLEPGDHFNFQIYNRLRQKKN